MLHDAQAVARQPKTILLSLLTSENRRELMWGKQAMADALEPGALILDAITGRPEDIEEDARRLSKDGVKLVDVCLAGSSQVIADGRALALVGGKQGKRRVTRTCSRSFQRRSTGSARRGRATG